MVIEGWQELGLADPAVDRLLMSPKVDLLRRYRDGVFHFQPDYFDSRFMDFIRQGQDAAANPNNWTQYGRAQWLFLRFLPPSTVLRAAE